MEVVVSIPDKFVSDAPHGEAVSRQMLEAFAIENYRQEKMSLGGLAELLGFSIDEANAFLKKHRIPLEYDFQDLAEDRKAIEMFLNK
jgi:predicted HTH domain antitoxin